MLNIASSSMSQASGEQLRLYDKLKDDERMELLEEATDAERDAHRRGGRQIKGHSKAVLMQRRALRRCTAVRGAIEKFWKVRQADRMH